MISIITPIYQSERYLTDTIKSVLDQSYSNWELLLINDGSTDQSKDIALSFQDSRIRYFKQENKGVSAARNMGLANMKGDFFCFLDADDQFPVRSLESRYKVLQSSSDLTFADGKVKKFDQEMQQLIDTWTPQFTGEPLADLVSLTGKSFRGQTWLIRREKGRSYQFDENITHAEDLFFFMELARNGGVYAFSNETILHYRISPNSAMSNLEGLEKGYRYVENKIKSWVEVNPSDFRIFQWRYKKAMTLAYLRKKRFTQAFHVWF